MLLPRIHTTPSNRLHIRRLLHSCKCSPRSFREETDGRAFCYSHVSTSCYDHHGDNFATPPHYQGGTTDNAYLRLTDGLVNLPPITHNPSPQIIPKTRSTYPGPYHDTYSAGHRAIPRSNTDEPPISLVPMDNLIAHHPFPRDVQDEQVLRVFMP